MGKIVYKCACCAEIVENFSQYVQQGLGQIVCLKCEKEREYEIDAMLDARYRGKQ